VSGLEWDRELIESDRFRWVAFLVCGDCGMTWRGLLPNERPGVEGAVEEQCPDCWQDDCDADERRSS
jgi:hypothetical protein